MSALTRQAIHTLESLRLPALQARYQEVIGSPTRCPNRGFLVRKIAEALAVRDTERDAPTPPSPEPAEPPGIAPSTDDSDTMGAIEQHTEADSPSTPEPTAPEPTETDAPNAPEPSALPKPPRGRFRGMTVEELQHRHVEIVGRPSGSENKGYLVWKIREAEKGHVPLGKLNGRGSRGEPACVKVLPLRLESATIARLDETWRKHGIKNRTAFLRSAIEHYAEYLDHSAHAASASE
jgi:hypothetical protein